MAAVTLTERAANKVKELIQKGSPAEGGLRVKVVGGGCSGLSYQLDIDRGAPNPADKVIESNGVRVFLDPKSALFIGGTEIDWQESMMGSAFSFKNPNAKGTCGCGTSFTA